MVCRLYYQCSNNRSAGFLYRREAGRLAEGRVKDKLAFKKIFSLSYPEYSTDISIMAEPSSRIAGELPAESDSEDKDSNSGK